MSFCGVRRADAVLAKERIGAGEIVYVTSSLPVISSSLQLGTIPVCQKLL